MNNIETKTTTFKTPVGVYILDGARVVNTHNNVKSIVERFDNEDNGLITFIDDNNKCIDSLYLIENWDYYIF